MYIIFITKLLNSMFQFICNFGGKVSGLANFTFTLLQGGFNPKCPTRLSFVTKTNRPFNFEKYLMRVRGVFWNHYSLLFHRRPCKIWAP